MNTVLHIISGLGDGGAEGALFRLCQYDEAHQHHVISLTDSGKFGLKLEALGIPVTYLNIGRGSATFTGMWRLWRQVKKVRPDVVQTWMYHADLLGGIVARLAGVKNVVWGIRNSGPARGDVPFRTILIVKLCAWLSHYVPKRIVCCAERSREIHAALGYDRGRMCVLPNGYDLSRLQPDTVSARSVREELGIGIEAPLIGFVARFDPQKDHLTLLRSLAVMKAGGWAPICLLVGTGIDPGNKVLSEAIIELNLGSQVRLLGPRNDVPAIMNAIDLHVLSSRNEGFPNVLAEAMACGTPCVTTDVGDAGSIVGNTGWIVPISNPTALARAIVQALQERGTSNWQNRKVRARDLVTAKFTMSRMLQDFDSAWKE